MTISYCDHRAYRRVRREGVHEPTQGLRPVRLIETLRVERLPVLIALLKSEQKRELRRQLKHELKHELRRELKRAIEGP